MNRDKLFLLKPGFEDPAYPGQIFYCWHCALMEGLLASFPDLMSNIEVVRVDWKSPRRSVIDLIGVENQTLPVLVLADGADVTVGTGQYQGRQFVQGKDEIVRALSTRCGIPVPHP